MKNNRTHMCEIEGSYCRGPKEIDVVNNFSLSRDRGKHLILSSMVLVICIGRFQ